MSAYISPTDFKDYIIKNNFVVTAAAITIGISSATFIKSFVGNLLMPSVYFVIGKIILQNVNNKLYKTVTDIFGDKASFDLDNFFKELLTWIFIVIGVYLILEFVIRKWLLKATTTNTLSPAQHPYLSVQH